VRNICSNKHVMINSLGLFNSTLLPSFSSFGGEETSSFLSSTQSSSRFAKQSHQQFIPYLYSSLPVCATCHHIYESIHSTRQKHFSNCQFNQDPPLSSSVAQEKKTKRRIDHLSKPKTHFTQQQLPQSSNKLSHTMKNITNTRDIMKGIPSHLSHHFPDVETKRLKFSNPLSHPKNRIRVKSCKIDK